MKFTELKLKDYSNGPFGRYSDDGTHNGQRYRDDFLIPALKNYDVVTLILDVDFGIGNSFLEEVFGGLVRLFNYSPDDLKTRLNIISEDSFYIDEINKYIIEANS